MTDQKVTHLRRDPGKSILSRPTTDANLLALRKAFHEKPTDHNWHKLCAATYGGQPIGFRGTPAKR